MPEYETAIVRFRTGENQTAGLGLLVGADHVVTCAHVVNTALGRDQREQEKPAESDYVDLDFPRLPRNVVRRARVVRWKPPPRSGSGSGDVAGLELTEEAPAGAARARFAKSGLDAPGLRVFGYPVRPARENGMWVDLGLIKGEVEGGLYQAESLSGQSVKAQPGYSGSPVWNASIGQPVGLLNAAPGPKESERDAYILTSLAVAQVWEDVFDYLLVPENPYRGLEPFRTQDAAVFFGRGTDITKLAARVDDQSVVVVTGPSGVGKTSLVQAGLTAGLGDYLRCAVITFGPGHDPWKQLAYGLLSIQHGDKAGITTDEAQRVIARLRTDGFGSVAAQLLRGENRRLLITIDQFEELWAKNESPDRNLLDLLLPPPEAADPAVRLVLTLRADFLPALQSIPGFHTRLNESVHNLSPLTIEQMREAIEYPATGRSVVFEEGLAEYIASDATRGTLPALEFTLTKLWETQRQKKLSFAAYHQLGGVAQALDKYAEGVLGQLTTQRKAANEDFINSVLLRLVRTVDANGMRLTTRERVFRTKVPAVEWEVLQCLADAGLVILDAVSTDHRSYAELAHDSLITEWPRLRDLAAKQVQFSHWLDRMQKCVADAEALPDEEIPEARHWLNTRPDGISSLIKDYIERSESTFETRLHQLQAERDRAETLRLVAEAELARRKGAAREDERDRVRPTATHFARLSYDWGAGITGGRASYTIEGVTIPADELGYLQGSVAISCPDIGPTSSYGRVFDSDFQKSVTDLQERNILRPSGYYFHTQKGWTRSSYLVYGEITKGDHFTPAFIGVEVHDYGAVSVYFKEYTKDATIDELVGWWIFGALWMGLEIHALLGTSGSAHAAVLFDSASVIDHSYRGRSSLLHGPFSLLPPKRERKDEEERYNWPRIAARREIFPLGAHILGRAADEESEWPPWSAHERLSSGRRSTNIQVTPPGRRKR